MTRKIWVILFLTIVAASTYTSAYGTSTHLSAFNTKYGTSATVLNTCTTCHTSPPTLNPYGTAFMMSGHNFTTIEPQDSDGDTFTNIVEINARTFPGDPASKPASDTTLPTVSSFTIPATSTSLTVPVTAFTATDNVGVTGYKLTETATKPLATATGWTTAAPTSYAFATAGAKTLYAWAKDAAGNVSNSLNGSVTITLPSADTTPPTVNSFTIPATSTSLTVPITAFTATDNVGVTGYKLTETSTKPLATATGWTATAPTSYACTTAGAKTLYAWAKDAAGNVSNSLSGSTTITLPPAADTTPPTVSFFTIPATSTSLTVTITTFTATDNVGVTGYLLTESATKPASSDPAWTAAKPTGYTFASAGAKTLYAWAKDAAGNVSTSRSDTCTITLPPTSDTTPPTVNTFSVPATSSSLTVPISAFTATDNVAVTGHKVTESATKPTASATGWTAAAPTSYAFTTAGAKTLYAWAKDAAGNVSNSLSATTTVTLPPAADKTLPTVTAFTVPASSNSLTVPVTAFAATDNVGVIGFLITESLTKPAASAAGWNATAPANHTCSKAGARTLYAWAKDAAGNVSAGKSARTTVTVQDIPQDMSFWVGKWFKVTEKNTGYSVDPTAFTRQTHSFVGYLTFSNWDPDKQELKADRYEYDANAQQWNSESIKLSYITGSVLDFLCSSQVSEKSTKSSWAFSARVKGKLTNGNLTASFTTLGGYYVELHDDSGSSEYYAGALSITGPSIPQSSVPVPAEVLLR